MPPSIVGTGIRARVMKPTAATTGSSFWTVATSGPWINLGESYRAFGIRCVRNGSVGTSNFNVSLRGSNSTKNTTGAAVGTIPAYTPTTLISYSQSLVGKLKLSTALVPAQYIKVVLTAFTTAANRALRIELTAIP